MGKTAPFEDFPFVGPSSASISPNIDAERSINLYYEPAFPTPIGARPALIGTPGLSLFSSLGGFAGVRALFAGNGRLFAVGSAHFYEISTTSGAIIHDYGAMAGDTGINPLQCRIEQNAIGQLLICNPFFSQLYYVDSGGGTLTSVFNAYALEMLDGFAVAIAAGASLVNINEPNQINVSNFNDVTTWNALNFVLKEGSTDAINQLAVVNNLLWIFGQKNIEIWYNAGNPNFPFARVNGGTLNVGCPLPETVVKVNNSVMWVGSSERGGLMVYKANGMQPVRVSTPFIEAVMNPVQDNVNSMIGTNAFAYEENGHVFYVLNFGSTYINITLVYDLTTGVWHERAWFNGGVQQLALPQVHAAVASTPYITTIRRFVGDRLGNIYLMGLAYTNDNGVAIQRQRTCSHLTDGGRWIKYPFFEVEADIGTAAITMSYSNNGGRTFPALNRSDATKTGSTDQGDAPGGGTYPRYKWWQCGRARKRTFKITITDSSNPIRIVNGWVGIGPGTEQ